MNSIHIQAESSVKGPLVCNGILDKSSKSVFAVWKSVYVFNFSHFSCSHAFSVYLFFLQNDVHALGVPSA